ncbi:hypothetical protein K435DRAFT_869914 [Dendrothele bispora CBS 962.96]|uniref:F-box domain-containing protein n=1 Tax=Dendrothele bispora (strain CBS 962.96) TaxID=1314807 RepID=A0A4S8L800_DENBC|nr:hypothetical protein K435DRAFT_869914 [Dendrothele bispora CBS 962.96]
MLVNGHSIDSIASAEVVNHWLTQSRLSGFSVSRVKRSESAAVAAHINRQLAGVDSRIRDTRTSLEDLQTQRGALLTVLDLVNNFRAPIRLLPVEILSTIFYYCVSATRSRRNGGIFDAIRIASVCSSWRSIALQDKRLWTDLYIRSMWQSVAADEVERDMLETFRARNGAESLSLSVVGGLSAVVYEPVTLAVLRDLAPRCATLVLLDIDETHYSSLMEAVDGFCPTTLHVENRLSDNTLDLASIAFKSTVRTLRTTLPDGLYNGEWESLRSLDVGDMGHQSTLSERLPFCSSLQALTLRFGEHTTAYPTLISDSVILLELITTSPSGCNPHAVFRDAMLPRLQHLVMQGDWTSWETCSHQEWSIAVKSLTLLSTCVLTSLSINGMYGTDCCLTKLLDVLPALRKLVFIALKPRQTVVNPKFGDLFRRLTFPNFADRAMGDPLCRYLTDLQLEFSLTSFDEVELSGMINSRTELLPYQQMWGWSKLQNVVVSVTGVFRGEDSLQSLRHLRDARKLTLLLSTPCSLSASDHCSL